VEWYWEAKTEKLEKNLVQVPLCPQQIPDWLPWDRTVAYAVTGQRNLNHHSWTLWWDSNPGPLNYVSSMLTTQPRLWCKNITHYAKCLTGTSDTHYTQSTWHKYYYYITHFTGTYNIHFVSERTPNFRRPINPTSRSKRHCYAQRSVDWLKKSCN
jgi:hypothetical protein